MSITTSNQIEPFYFGPPGHQLFGCYHEPAVWPARAQGLVICYPAGQEYIRSHRACHRLAARAARAGFAALRFDYFGTGDSAGEVEDADLDQWQNDIRLAVAELKARSGIEAVILAGLRLGASLALCTAPRIAGLAGLILWEPVVSGRSYLTELQSQHDDLMMRFTTQPKDHSSAHRPTELLGFAMKDTLWEAIDGLDLLQVAPPHDKPVLLIESHSQPEIAALGVHLQRGAEGSHIQVPSFTVWTEDVDKGLVPQPVIEAISAWLERTFA